SPAEFPTVGEILARRFCLKAVVGDKDGPRPGALPLIPADPRWLGPGGPPVDRSLRAPGGDAPWKINRSSRTTGLPKGTRRTHRQQFVLDERCRAYVGDAQGDRYLAMVELGFLYGLGIAFDVLNEGGMVRIARPDVGMDDLVGIIDREHINRL